MKKSSSVSRYGTCGGAGGVGGAGRVPIGGGGDDCWGATDDVGGVCGGGLLVQQGPVQCFNFCLSFDVLNPEHLTCSQFLQNEHSTQTDTILLVQIGQVQIGPGFCSIPARINNSRIRHAGVAFSFVCLVKNSE